jgi:hypothetical protein
MENELKRTLTATLAVAMIALAAPVMAQGTIKANPESPVTKPKPDEKKADVHFRNCSEARAAGYSRMRVGQPGYARHLDRDNDGIACE